MNIQQLRKSLKIKWVKYYHQNRPWLEKMRIWGTYDGYRRPSSGFILATLSVLEPKLDEFFPFILELNNNPDEIIAALGLNFNPEESNLIEDYKSVNQNQVASNSVQAEFVDKFRADSSKDTEIKQPTASNSTAITKIESFPFPQAVQSTFESESIEKEFQAFSELLQENTPQEFTESSMVAKLESEEEVLSLLSMCNEAEEQEVIKESKEQETEEIKAASKKKVSNLASWIDEFCQGAGWDREEAIFIPF
ncbi:hypothetical protein Riv7116_4648 [Rivularia sp. PCC 7116]|uniref:DUF5331 domain-containing protein n=1 Tax=Rivularia sp. PCC 7116 TaxID=373994 RepID=UPI00029ED4C7|nr:DUF5331 domain-containing protein [Rivularia sp. PCC 7116]AFY57067.1 hypothetical protein Riv7116_4648 [Rivularia sp. PCC 7116]